MGTSRNWLKAFERVRHAMLLDAVHMARLSLTEQPEKSRAELGVPESWLKLPDPPLPDLSYVNELLARVNGHAEDPAAWQRRQIEAQLAKPRTAQTYMKLRRALWNWPEFAGVTRRARTILETVIELAREEAFPWLLAVCAEDVRRLSRLSLRSYIRSVHELDCLAVTRPGRIVELCRGTVMDHGGVGDFPGRVDDSQPMQSIAQWVVIYRRGVPWNRKRAAWWINYDLLCETGRVMPCFAVQPATLAKPYQDRNERLGPRVAISDPFDPEDSPRAEEFDFYQRLMSRKGPKPPPGLRAALWEPV